MKCKKAAIGPFKALVIEVLMTFEPSVHHWHVISQSNSNFDSTIFCTSKMLLQKEENKNSVIGWIGKTLEYSSSWKMILWLFNSPSPMEICLHLSHCMHPSLPYNVRGIFCKGCSLNYSAGWLHKAKIVPFVDIFLHASESIVA